MSMLKRFNQFMPSRDDTVGTVKPPTPPAAEAPEPVNLDATPEPVAPSPPPVANDTRPEPRERAVQRSRRREPDTSSFLTTKSGDIDGRSARRTGRTAMLSLKVAPELPRAIKSEAIARGISMGELMEHIWDAYEQLHHRPARGRGRGGKDVDGE